MSSIFVHVTRYKLLVTASCLLVTGYGLVVTFIPVHAALIPRCNPAPGIQIDPNQTNVPTCGVEHIIQVLVNIYNLLLGLSALVLFLMLVWGGIQMISHSFWENSDEVLKSGKYTITRSITGFVIVLAAYLIVQTLLLVLGYSKGIGVF